jgi:RING-box protein 1
MSAQQASASTSTSTSASASASASASESESASASGPGPGPGPGSGSGSGSALATANVRAKVKKWTAVAFWSYDIENDTCAICHNALMVPCISCEAEPQHAEECSVAWGQCGHSYHFHCITRWLKTRSTCPLDDKEWEFVQY